MRLSTSILVIGLMIGLSACDPDADSRPVEGPVAALPDAGATLTRIAFGSCVDEELEQPIWSAIAEANPDLFLLLGDNIYADWVDGQPIETQTVEIIAEAYRTFGARPEFADFRARVPIMATWDDHDYGKNDSGADFPLKAQSKALMLDFFHIPEDAPVRDHDGVYNATIFGPPGRRVQIIMLDTRWFRSSLKPTDDWGAPGKERFLPDDDPAKTVLGTAQWAWLGEQLRKPAELRLLVSSIQVIAEAHGWERWGNFPPERQRLLDLIRDSGAQNVVMLSGDRHVGGFYRLDGVAAYPLYELTSSSLNKPFAKGLTVAEMGPHQLGHLFGPENFGLATVDWSAETLSLELKDAAGATVRAVTISLDDLKVAAK